MMIIKVHGLPFEQSGQRRDGSGAYSIRKQRATIEFRGSEELPIPFEIIVPNDLPGGYDASKTYTFGEGSITVDEYKRLKFRRVELAEVSAVGLSKAA